MLSTEQYKDYCKKYFRDMYSAGWCATVQADVPKCESICQLIRNSPNSDEAVAYNSYVNYRNSNPNKYSQQNDVSTEQKPVEHVNDVYTSKDGLLADERLEASQKHTIIMLLTDIAVSCRAMAKAMNATRDDDSVNVYEHSVNKNEQQVENKSSVVADWSDLL